MVNFTDKDGNSTSWLQNPLVEKELQRCTISQLMYIAKDKVGIKQLLVEFLTDKKIKL